MWLYFVSFEVVFREYQESKRQTSDVKQSIWKNPHCCVCVEPIKANKVN